MYGHPPTFNCARKQSSLPFSQSAKEFKTKEEFEVQAYMLLWNGKTNVLTLAQKACVTHIETTLARSLFNCDEL